jgi:hypothetical protein
LGLGTLVPMNIEVPTKYPLSQDRIIAFEIRLHSKSPMLHRPALHGNSNALKVSLEERSRTNSPRQRFHSQLFCKIVRYFFRTLYILYAVCIQTSVSIFVIRRDVVHTKRVKCEVCPVRSLN